MEKHNKVKKSDFKWYYNIDTRKDIFRNRIETKLKLFLYSAVELGLLLQLINDHEPALIDIIISFIGIEPTNFLNDLLEIIYFIGLNFTIIYL